MMSRHKIIETYLALQSEADKALMQVGQARTNCANLRNVEAADAKLKTANDYLWTYQIMPCEIRAAKARGL